MSTARRIHPPLDVEYQCYETVIFFIALFIGKYGLFTLLVNVLILSRRFQRSKTRQQQLDPAAINTTTDSGPISFLLIKGLCDLLVAFFAFFEQEEERFNTVVSFSYCVGLFVMVQELKFIQYYLR